jgi:MoxR-like ATPase
MSATTTAPAAAPAPDSQLEARMADLSPRLAAARAAIHDVIIGQPHVVTQCLTTILAGGHFLIVGLPGLGKTKLVETLGIVLGLDEKRVQCTPDLMPADIIGSEILSPGDGRHFTFVPGPVFAQLLMADEVNRASPRTQSALLQAMQEYAVTVGGQTHALPRPFHVMATQNPLEQEGTYPLPEAQLDRFMLQIDIGYPDRAEERRMIALTTGAAPPKAQKILSAEDILEAQDIVRRMPVGDSVVDAILSLVAAGRPEQSNIAAVQKHVSWAPGPRAAQALMLACRARALLDGRYAPSVDDVIALAPAALKHRMGLHYSARAEGVTLADVIRQMIDAIR